MPNRSSAMQLLHVAINILEQFNTYSKNENKILQVTIFVPSLRKFSSKKFKVVNVLFTISLLSPLGTNLNSINPVNYFSNLLEVGPMVLDVLQNIKF